MIGDMEKRNEKVKSFAGNKFQMEIVKKSERG